MPEEDFFQILQACQLHDTGIGYFGAIKIEILQLGQVLHLIQASVCDGGVFQMQSGHTFETTHVGKAGIGDFGPGEIHPFDLVGQRFESHQTVILKVGRHIECAEPKITGVLGNLHERGSRLFDSGNDRGGGLDFGFDLFGVLLRSSGGGQSGFGWIFQEFFNGLDEPFRRLGIDHFEIRFGTGLDPEFQKRYFFFRQLGLITRRHVLVIVPGQVDTFHGEGTFGIPGFDGGAVSSSFQNGLEGIHAEFAFLLVRAMATNAFGCDHRSDDIFVKLGIFQFHGGSGRKGKCSSHGNTGKE